jgi:hypothetical protein
MEDIIKFNKDQIEHLQILQKQVLEFCNKLFISAIEHDTSKWSEKEYAEFVKQRSALRGSVDGKDKAYQDGLKTEAIQHHVKNNPHHAEYWDERNLKMPMHEIISMFFDWNSRCIAKGGDMEKFWDYNIAKLKNQTHAIPIVEAMKSEWFPK